MSEIPGMQCIELIPGANHYVVPKEIKKPEPPDDFIDRNVYYYRLVEGRKVFKGVALGPGWENQTFNPNCEMIREGEEMPKKDIDFEAIVAKAKQIMTEQDVSLYQASQIVAKETGLHRTTIYNHTRNAIQTTNLAQTQEEPEATVKDVLPMQVWTEEDKQLAHRLRDEGYTLRQISDRMGFTYSQIKGFFERERERKRKQSKLEQTDVLDQYKAKWIRDIMFDDLDPPMQLQIVSAIQRIVLEVG